MLRFFRFAWLNLADFHFRQIPLVYQLHPAPTTTNEKREEFAIGYQPANEVLSMMAR